MGATHGVDEPVLGILDRVARAKEALRLAEERTGARTLRIVADQVVEQSADRPRPGLPDGGALAAAQPAPRVLRDTEPGPEATHLREQVAGDERLTTTDRLVSTERPPLPIPPQLRDLVPEGLRRGSVTVVSGSTSLLLSLLAEASQAGSWGALVGAPSINLLAAAQAGVDLSRLVLVPGPGIESAATVAALLDGMDIVVVGPEVALVDSDRRRLAARARERASVLLAMRPWQGAGMTLTADRSRWSGLGVGHGRLHSRLLTVSRSGRSGAGIPLSRDLWLPLETSGGPLVQETALAQAAAPGPLTVAALAGASAPAVPSVPASQRLPLAQVG